MKLPNYLIKNCKLQILVALLLVLSSSCATSSKTSDPATNTVTPSPVVNLPPVISSGEGVTLKTITLECDSSCTAEEKAEVPAIEAHMNATLKSQCLAEYFLKTPTRRLDNTNGLTPNQILTKLQIPTHLTLNYYYQRFTSALGYESADDFTVIHFNRAKLGGFTVCQKASLGAHEFSHTKNFFHNGNKAAPNYYTIPYQINNAFEGNDDMKACCVE